MSLLVKTLLSCYPVILVSLLAVTAHAVPATPLDIQSPTMEANQNTGLVTFSGGVTLTRGDLTLTANTVTAQTSQGKGKKGSTDIQTVTAIGNVTITKPGGEKATGDKAIYNLTNHQLEMTGNVHLTRAGSTLSGTRLTYDTESGNVRVTNSGAPVRAHFEPATSNSNP